MASNVTRASAEVPFENEYVTDTQSNETPKEKPKYVRRIVWRNVIIFLSLHIASLYGVYLACTSAKWMTVIFATFLYQLSAFGITAGAHRLWAHRSYKAKWPLQLLLMILNTMAFQDPAIHWARDHRVHHKYSDTDADPYNAARGFFFSHIGWLLVHKHPEIKEKGKGIDMSDLENNPILAFQRKYYTVLMPLICFILPTVIPVVFWNEAWSNAYFIPTVFRYVFTLNVTWLVNSAAHLFGSKPYDKYIYPSENKGVAIVTLGEGWHNYHHTFPWDYKAAELGNYSFNFTTALIDIFAKIGWAYDLKTAPENIVEKRVEKTGDGSHELWGWGDKDQSQEERDQTLVKFRARMAPNVTRASAEVPFKNEYVTDTQSNETPKEKPKYIRRIVWKNVIIFLSLHIASLYGVYLACTSAKWMTVIFAILLYLLSVFGITAGAHRLWAHRSYKAKWPLQLFLMILNTMAFQDPAIDWARDHRVHHKYTDTDADPYNPARGFFFAHIGWLLVRKHPEVKEKGKGIDISDLENNSILTFQKKYYAVIMSLICFILPTVIPIVCWNETWSNAYFIPAVLRCVFWLNMTWLVNSAAHSFGNKPYDKHIKPSENRGTTIMTLGEGWHNYHHTFPWDYKAAELGNYNFNFTTAFINIFAKIGWAYDLKTVSKGMVKKRVEKTGDGSHELWGWGDKDQSQEERDQALVKYSSVKDE